MAQEYITINGIKIRQPDKGLGYDFKTQYTEDTGRVQSGTLHATPLFTVESFSYSASFLTLDEMKTILQQVARGNSFRLHYFSPYFGTWRTDDFYVSEGSLSIGRLNEDNEKYESLEFTMQGVNPI